jgi:hypothetical protein
VKAPEQEDERFTVFFTIPGLEQALEEYITSLWEQVENP